MIDSEANTLETFSAFSASKQPETLQHNYFLKQYIDLHSIFWAKVLLVKKH